MDMQIYNIFYYILVALIFFVGMFFIGYILKNTIFKNILEGEKESFNERED